ncbi:MAG TPA: metal-sulfur cluster assembly factor [Actinomycetota bacterium]|nr:metal-sulfur cluster assembly factor [Actinomycetota bacterium]
MPTSQQVIEALKVVQDPEIGINIVDLGLVYEVVVTDDGEAQITFTLTSVGCPAGAQIENEIREAAASVDGISSVSSEMTMTPPWGPDKMSELARSALGFF